MKNITLIAIFVLIGCAHSPPKLVEKNWSNNLLIGHSLILIDRNIIEEYNFYADGDTTATIGEQKYILWPIIKIVSVSGPLLSWEIKNNELVITNGDGTIIKKMVLKGIYDDNKFVVISEGKELVYKRMKN